MKHFKRPHPQAMTLLELTVVILVLLSLIGLLFAASRAWKAGADRSACILNQSNMQKAMRGNANMRNYIIGQTVPDMASQLIGTNGYLPVMPSCPLGGTYTLGGDLGPDVIPPQGTIYMPCSHADSHDHRPTVHDDW